MMANAIVHKGGCSSFFGVPLNDALWSSGDRTALFGPFTVVPFTKSGIMVVSVATQPCVAALFLDTPAAAQ